MATAIFPDSDEVLDDEHEMLQRVGLRLRLGFELGLRLRLGGSKKLIRLAKSMLKSFHEACDPGLGSSLA